VRGKNLAPYSGVIGSSPPFLAVAATAGKLVVLFRLPFAADITASYNRLPEPE